MSSELLDSINQVGARLESWRNLALQYDAERMDLRAENERLAARAEAAEARLKALCEAEPWAYGAEIDGKVWVTTSIHGRLPDARALIPRPSMEGKNNG